MTNEQLAALIDETFATLRGELLARDLVPLVLVAGSSNGNKALVVLPCGVGCTMGDCQALLRLIGRSEMQDVTPLI